MVTKTRAQLIAMAADNLMIVGSGQTLADEDSEKIDAQFDVLIGELSARGVCDVDNEDEIPAELCGALAELLANEAAPAFGLPKMSIPSREAIEDRLRVMIRRVQASNRTLKTDLPTHGVPYTLARWTSGR